MKETGESSGVEASKHHQFSDSELNVFCSDVLTSTHCVVSFV